MTKYVANAMLARRSASSRDGDLCDRSGGHQRCAQGIGHDQRIGFQFSSRPGLRRLVLPQGREAIIAVGERSARP